MTIIIQSCRIITIIRMLYKYKTIVYKYCNFLDLLCVKCMMYVVALFILKKY